MKRIVSIDGADGYYITNTGRVLCSRPVKNQFGTSGWKRFWKAQRHQNSGYKITDIVFSGKQKTKTIHRLVALHFIENPLLKSDVNHIDGNKNNNCVENLEWNTKSENSKHAYRIGLQRVTQETIDRARKMGSEPKTDEMKKRISVARVKISLDEAMEIKSFYSNNDISIANTAKKFSVSGSTVQKCIHNTFRCWDLNIGEEL